MTKTHFGAAVLTILLFGSCKKQMQDSASTTDNETVETIAKPSGNNADAAGNYEPNELIVKFKNGTSDAAKAAKLARINANVKERIITAAMKRAGDTEGIYLLHTPLHALEAISQAKGIEIEYAEPNYIYQHTAATNDTYVANGSLWGMDATNIYGSRASTAWAAGHTGSASVVVGVIDEGIQLTHPDLAGQIWTNPFDAADGIDNDGNGYVDDINGWDFDGNNNSVYDGGSRGSLDDHGTHV
ncbi:MAG: S8 family serine peptidase, partial [Bacteroidota bacterium]